MATNNSINSPVLGGISTLTANGILLGNGAGTIAASAALTAGQVLSGVTSGAPVATTITGAGTVTVTNPSSGSIVITGSGGGSGFTWASSDTTTGGALVANNGYIADAIAQTTYTLPTSAVRGATFTIMAGVLNTGSFKVNAGTLQSIRFGTAIGAANGSITGSAASDVLTLTCISAPSAGSEVFAVSYAVGNFTVA